MKEIEILVKLIDKKKKVLKVLSSFKYINEERIKDIYYFHPDLNILHPEKNGRFRDCFRTRVKGNRNLIAYKKDYFNKKDIWQYSEEHETSIGEFETISDILNALGFEILVEIDNTKYKYLHKKYEIVFEEVKGLGLFLEVEFKGNSHQSPKKIKKEIYNFISSLGLRFVELNFGKPELLYKKKMRIGSRF